MLTPQVRGDHALIGKDVSRRALRNFVAVLQGDEAVCEFGQERNLVIDDAQCCAMIAKVAQDHTEALRLIAELPMFVTRAVPE